MDYLIHSLFQTRYFDGRVGTGAVGTGALGERGARGHGDESNFYSCFFYYLLQKNFISRWHRSVGMASDYMIHSLFLDYIFFWGGGSVGTGVWGQECGAIFF